MAWLSASITICLRRLMRWIFASLLPQLWDEIISTSTCLIKIRPPAALQGGIPLERLFALSLDYLALWLFGSVCYVLLPSCECTKLTAQSVECAFLRYNDEQKGNRCSAMLVIGCAFLIVWLLMSRVPCSHVPPRTSWWRTYPSSCFLTHHPPSAHTPLRLILVDPSPSSPSPPHDRLALSISSDFWLCWLVPLTKYVIRTQVSSSSPGFPIILKLLMTP
jgi:hypothetical protein